MGARGAWAGGKALVARTIGVAVPPSAKLVVLLVLSLLSAGCLARDDGGGDDPLAPDERTDDASLRPLAETFSGTATGNPAMQGQYDFPFEVPSGAVGLNGTLSWDGPVARMRLELLDPSGKVAETGRADPDGRVVLATVDPPKPGTWTYRVTAIMAVNVPFTLEAVADLIVPAQNVDRQTRTLGAASFYEINLILEEGASFNFSFEATGPVKWDVHSHPPGGVKYWQEGEGESGGASFTAPSRAVYSVLFENPGAQDLTLRYEILGRFRLHSHSG